MVSTSLKEYIDQIKLADTHEHLIAESLRNKVDLDFTYLMPMYLNSDLISAGMPVDELERIRRPGREMYQEVEDNLEPGMQTYSFKERLTEKEISLDEKWQIISPYWQRIQNTGYVKGILTATKNLFDIDVIDDHTYKPLSEALQKNRKSGWYDHVLHEKAGIDFCIVDNGMMPMGNPRFYPSVRFHRFVYVADRTALNRLEFSISRSITRLDDLIEGMTADMAQKKKDGMRAIKIMLAYRRSINFENADKAEAERVFDRLFTHPNANLSWEESKPMQDFMQHAVIRAAVDLNLPIQVHTGMQTGSGNVIANSRPRLLTNLFMRYQKARFDIFHAGYPYHSELAVLAKNFPNVYANLCWLPIISPWMAERVLSEWLEVIPISKIFAFGGDYTIVEGALGHAIITRQVVANVLEEKIARGYFSVSEAQDFAAKILSQNAREFYAIGSK